MNARHSHPRTAAGADAMRERQIGYWATVALIATAALILAQAPGATAQDVDQTRSGHTYHLDDLGSDCTDCHTTVEESVSSTDRLIPDHDTCFDCHDGFGAPDDCETCHTNSDEAVAEGVPPRNVDYFPHATHLESGIECETCHTRAGVNEVEQITFAMPAMETCTNCHDGVRAAIECETCHDLGAPASLLPASHDVAQWDRLHGAAAQDIRSTCTPCHVQEQDCDVCHRGDNLRGLPHREGFINSHAFTFYSKQKECAACHDFEVFCVSCHTTRRVFPANHSFANWAEAHGDFAEHDLEACAACHEEADPTCERSGCHDGLNHD